MAVLEHHEAQSKKALTTPANIAKIKATLHSVSEEEFWMLTLNPQSNPK